MGNIDVTWNTINEQVEHISDLVKQNNIDMIVGIARGGLVPAVMVSNRTKVPMQSLEWQTRDGNGTDRKKLIELQLDKYNCLFIDDICDTGKTIFGIRELFPGAKFAVLFNKMVDMELDFEGVRLYNNTQYQIKQWINFPWE